MPTDRTVVLIGRTVVVRVKSVFRQVAELVQVCNSGVMTWTPGCGWPLAGHWVGKGQLYGHLLFVLYLAVG